jgi:hypothetical protein
MLRTSNRLRRIALVSTLAIGAAGCGGGSDPIVQPTVDITGSYVATVFKVTPTNKPTIDVLARGGSLTLTIARDSTTSGSLMVPKDVIGDSVNVSLAGIVSQSGHAVRFSMASDTFVRTVGWLAGGGTIATDVNDGSAHIEVLLTRQ